MKRETWIDFIEGKQNEEEDGEKNEEFEATDEKKTFKQKTKQAHRTSQDKKFSFIFVTHKTLGAYFRFKRN